MINLLAAKFAQIDATIDTTTAQITALQAKLSELQEHRQQLLSVEQACQSALSQVDTALMMLHHVDPSQVDTFKDALVVKFATDAIGILEPADIAPTQPIEPEPTAPTAPEPTAPEIEPAIDVKVSTEEPIATAPAPTPTPGAATDIEGLLNKMSIQNIRKLASAKGTDTFMYAGNNRSEVEESCHGR
jgi:FtsZ-binding cell division protein ZapB